MVVAVLVTVDVLVGGPLSRLDAVPLAELFWDAGVREQRPGSPARVFFGVLADFGSWLPVLAVVLPWLALVCRQAPDGVAARPARRAGRAGDRHRPRG